MSNETILSVLAEKPGAIASEVGSTPVEMLRLEKAGLIERVGLRKNGGRGRPPVEWAVRGQGDQARTAEAKNDRRAPVKGAPKLVDADHIRPFLSGEEPRILQFIENTFAGKYGDRDLEDYRVLAGRYKDIVRQASKRANAKATIVEEDEDA
jgi:predicted ArsR family transcriptional regulator